MDAIHNYDNVKCPVCDSKVKVTHYNTKLGALKHKALCRNKNCKHKQVGKGYFEKFKDFIVTKQPKGPSDRFLKFMHDNKDNTIVGVHIGQKPISSAIEKILHVVSLGALDKKKKELGYKEIYHNYIILTFKNSYQNTKHWKMEKNHIIEVSKASQSDVKGTSELEVADPEMKLHELIYNANHEKFWHYHASNTNCQRFVYDIVTNNKFKILDPKALDVLRLQDGKKLLDTLPDAVNEGINIVTDTAAYIDG